jgi:flagellar export protein FliJ
VKVYRFSLATVLRIRALEERMARERLMLSQRDLRGAQERCRSAQTRLGQLEAPSGPTTINEVRWTGEQASRLADEVRASTAMLLAAASLRDEARESWRAASKRSSALERWDAQGRARWRDAATRAEATELDDLATARHARTGARA